MPRLSIAVVGAACVLHGCAPGDPGDRRRPPGGASNASSTRDLPAPRLDTLHAASNLPPSGPPPFTESARAAGLDFVHFNGMSGEYYILEMMGPGGALFDYDNDGDLDVFLPQGQMLGPGKTIRQALFPPQGAMPPRGRLFRNDLTVGPDGSRSLHFTDVTAASRIDARGYGMGVAAGDYDNDGWVDLYLTNYGDNQMWRNNGDGTFTDVTRRTGTNDSRWSVSAAFFDFDRDGWLDLYVGNYVNFRFEDPKRCFTRSGGIEYCGPQSYEPVPDRLFRNRGDGTFEDVSEESGIARERGAGLGVVCADFNGDGSQDLYVANDEWPNHLWINQGNGTFRNEALLAGCALSRDGAPESSMGVDAGDFDNDGDEDLILTNLLNQKTTLYVNDGKGWFVDRSYEAGLALPSRPFTGFGAAFFDYDNDGWLDVLTVNGEVRLIEALVRAKDPYPLHQVKQLFHNRGDGVFEEIGRTAGKAFELSEVSRGAAFGDVDNDGDTDVLIVNNNGPVRLLVNDVGNRRHWLGLRLVGERGGRDMLGTRVAVFRPRGPTLWRRARSDASYASANDPRVLVGLGDETEVAKVRAYWPSGRAEEWTGLPIDRYTTLREGSGRPLSGP